MLFEDINRQFCSIPSFVYNQYQTKRIFSSYPRVKRESRGDLKKMLDWVSKILSFLLADLENIYRLNGIDYKIHHLHYMLFRLLAPFELLPEQNTMGRGRGRGENNQLTNSDLGQQMESDKQRTRQQKKNAMEGSKKRRIRQEKHCKNTDSPNIQNEEFIYKKRLYRKEITKPILNPELECRLEEWVIKKINENKRIRRKDIGKKARQMSGNQQGFYASSGWVNRFMNRHPYLREIISKHAKGNIGRKSSDFYENSEEQDNEIQKLNNDANFGYQRGQLELQVNHHEQNEWCQTDKTYDKNGLRGIEKQIEGKILTKGERQTILETKMKKDGSKARNGTIETIQ